MIAVERRVSGMGNGPRNSMLEKDLSPEAGKKDMWSSMLDGVASGKRLPEKNILVLGGSPDTQKSFLEGLSNESSSARRPQDRHHNRSPPVANQFALGYTYQDVLDADHEDILARLSLYLVSDPSPAFMPLLKPLLTPHTIPGTAIVILLDWSQPWSWIRQLRTWVRALRSLLVSLDNDSKDVMEEAMINWRDRGRGGKTLDTAEGESGSGGDVSLPLGPGEWDEALGIPLCVVCQNAGNVDTLEKERGWKEEDFDFVLQFIRTILLKHGASLIYTGSSSPGSLQTLIYSTLGLQSLVQRSPLKHNVIDRDKILIPPNWDSWGKIRVLREGFDVEGISTAWSDDIQGSPEQDQPAKPASPESASTPADLPKPEASALLIYEETIADPYSPASLPNRTPTDALEVECQPTQDFLTGQLEIIEKLRVEEQQTEGGRKDSSSGLRYASHGSVSSESGRRRDGTEGEDQQRTRVNDHIGPVQFNVGGIQVDADDMLKRIKDRESMKSPEPQAASVATPEGKGQNEALASFFAGLMKRGGSAANSPRSGAGGQT